MPPPKLNAAAVWRDVEEHLVPAFSLWASDRVVFFYLLRASRLAGQRTILMPVRTLARATLLSRSTIRIALRRLAARHIIRILRRDYSGLRIAVRLPREIPGCVSSTRLSDGRSLDSLDFWSSRLRRGAIHRRDGNRCSYCLRRLRPHQRVLDHVVPRVRAGAAPRNAAPPASRTPATLAHLAVNGRINFHSFRNLVTCCASCNMLKRDRTASHLLRHLYRAGLLTAAEMRLRYARLRALAAGKLPPALHSN